jgi:predicted lipoprotein with Yx(FWY)xxD motif
MTRKTGISLALLLAAAVVAGAVAASASTTMTTTAAKAKAPALKLAKTGLGTIIVDKKGVTVYAFGHDLKNKSRCSGQCAQNWPPATAPAKPAVAKGLEKSKLKVIKRGDGSRQLSYKGHPLYRFIGDSGPGTTSGQNITAFGGTWHVLSKSGTVVKQAPGGSDQTQAPGGY